MTALLDQHISSLRRRAKDKLEEFRRFPPHHLRHFEFLRQLHQDGDYDRSVFIMTKFPEGDSEADTQLRQVIAAVAEEVRLSGYIPRLASDRRYHPMLWDNVELYLLGCARGIALVEDRYMPELNPNVAMEWGWMRGLGRDILFLVDDQFSHLRADWSGLLSAPFKWDDCRPGIHAAVSDWLR